MKKEFILYSIERLNHGTVATVYSRYNGHFKEVTFVLSSKKYMIETLRNKYDCVVPREFC